MGELLSVLCALAGIVLSHPRSLRGLGCCGATIGRGEGPNDECFGYESNTRACPGSKSRVLIRLYSPAGIVMAVNVPDTLRMVEVGGRMQQELKS